MENARFVGVGETLADSGHQTGDLFLFNGLAVGGVVEGLAVHEFHHDIEHVVDFTEVVDADKVRVVQLGHRLGLILEPFAKLPVFAKLAREDLDCHIAFQGLLVRLVDRPHSPLCDESQDIVGGKELMKLLGGGSLELWGEGHRAWKGEKALGRTLFVKKMCLNS